MLNGSSVKINGAKTGSISSGGWVVYKLSKYSERATGGAIWRLVSS